MRQRASDTSTTLESVSNEFESATGQEREDIDEMLHAETTNILMSEHVFGVTVIPDRTAYITVLRPALMVSHGGETKKLMIDKVMRTTEYGQSFSPYQMIGKNVDRILALLSRHQAVISEVVGPQRIEFCCLTKPSRELLESLLSCLEKRRPSKVMINCDWGDERQIIGEDKVGEILTELESVHQICRATFFLAECQFSITHVNLGYSESSPEAVKERVIQLVHSTKSKRARLSPEKEMNTRHFLTYLEYCKKQDPIVLSFSDLSRLDSSGFLPVLSLQQQLQKL